MVSTWTELTKSRRRTIKVQLTAKDQACQPNFKIPNKKCRHLARRPSCKCQKCRFKPLNALMNSCIGIFICILPNEFVFVHFRYRYTNRNRMTNSLAACINLRFCDSHMQIALEFGLVALVIKFVLIQLDKSLAYLAFLDSGRWHFNCMHPKLENSQC